MSTGWLFVFSAVVSNVFANVMLKKTVAALPPEGGLAALRAALGMGTFWGFAAGGALLLGFYALALKSLDLSVAYAVVTSAALVGMFGAAAWFLDEPATPIKAIGCVFIIIGIVLISRPS